MLQSKILQQILALVSIVRYTYYFSFLSNNIRYWYKFYHVRKIIWKISCIGKQLFDNRSCILIFNSFLTLFSPPPLTAKHMWGHKMWTIFRIYIKPRLLWWLSGKESVRNTGDTGSILGQEDPLVKRMAAHSNIVVWRIPWTEQPGGLQSMVSQSQTWLKPFSPPAHVHKTQRTRSQIPLFKLLVILW